MHIDHLSWAEKLVNDLKSTSGDIDTYELLKKAKVDWSQFNRKEKEDIFLYVLGRAVDFG